MDKKYISQIGEEKKLVLDKKFIFKNSINKSPRRTQTHDMRFTSPLILPLSYGDI